MKIRMIPATIISAVLIMSVSTIGAEEAKVQTAIREAESWLSVVDREMYEESWDQAALYFRNAIPKEQWLASMNAFRKPLGSVIERKLKSHQYATSLPGAPDGEYVVIQFEAVFEHKKEAIETITPMIDADGTWRVSGYFIK